MSVKTAKWDGAEFLTTPERIAAYLDVVLEEGDPDMIKVALGNIARSKGMTEIERGTGIRRTSLYRALSPEGNPEFATVVNVLKALGLRLSVAVERTNRRETVRTGADPALRTVAAKSGRPPKRTKRA